MSLIVHPYSQEHYNAVRIRAIQLGLFKKLKIRLDRLAEYGCHDGDSTRCKVTLTYDSAPLSFGLIFQFRKRDSKDQYEDGYPGGLIFHGRHDGHGGGGAPTFAVTLNDVDEDWSVHT